MLTEGVLIAFITGGLAIVSNVIVSAAGSSKTLYRIDQLEKKVEKHNNLIERMTKVEQSDKAQWYDIQEIKAKLP